VEKSVNLKSRQREGKQFNESGNQLFSGAKKYKNNFLTLFQKLGGCH
jgi:hypothetical protein